MIRRVVEGESGRIYEVTNLYDREGKSTDHIEWATSVVVRDEDGSYIPVIVDDFNSIHTVC